MLMKRLLCLLLCLAMLVPAALAAETADLPRLFNAQFITGGGGLRGKATLTASGEAEWLELLLPFTAAEINLRAIGQKQGGESAKIDDDDAWQVRLYVEDAAKQSAGDTWLYSEGDDVYFSSAMLPGYVLRVPTEGVHLLYDLARSDWSSLLFGFDPYDLKGRADNGRPLAYEAIAGVMGVDEADWNENWAPVLQKYELELDLWLAGYGKATTATADGALAMGVTYTIPADDLKDMAKHFIGSMLFDSELQALLMPYVTDEERATYLNPTMVYFYNACIDALPLTGDVVLRREMSALGEVLSTTIELPLPALPGELTSAVGGVLADVFSLPYEDALDGADRLVLTATEDALAFTLQGSSRTIALNATQTVVADKPLIAGTLSITPAVGMDEAPLFAAFTWQHDQRIYEDEDTYRTHDVSSYVLSLTPDAALEGGIDFAAINVALSVDYHTDLHTEGSPVQINIDLAASLPDAEIGLELLLRTRSGWALDRLPTEGAIDVSTLSEEDAKRLRETFVREAVKTIIGLNPPVSTEAPAAE